MIKIPHRESTDCGAMDTLSSYVTQHIKMDQFGQKLKIDIYYFLNGFLSDKL